MAETVCPVCGGLGEITRYQWSILSKQPHYKWIKCEECDGWGYIYESNKDPEEEGGALRGRGQDRKE